MAQIISPKLSQKLIFFSLIFGLAITLNSCQPGNLVDVNVALPQRVWAYRNHLTVPFEVKDAGKRYNLYFKLRHTADYKYANIFILAHFKAGSQVLTKRYQYKLAKNDGEWLGSGSGNLYNYILPLKTNYTFGKAGKYSVDIEQNMRDNPLLEISDIGLLVEEAP